MKKIVSKRKFIASIAKYSSLLLFLFIAVKSSYVLSFGVKPIVNIDSGFLEMELLLKNIVLDESCKIIKVNADQPNIDYYFGLQQNTVFFGPDSFYEKLKNYHKKGVCFYYHHKDYSEGDVIRDDKHRVDVKRVDELFNSCNKTIEFESPWEIRPFTLIRYDC